MDVDGGVVIAVEEKRIAILFENLRHRPSVPDCGLGARLRRGMIAGQVPGRGFVGRGPLPNTSRGPRANSCDLLRGSVAYKVSRFLSRLLAGTVFFSEDNGGCDESYSGSFLAAGRPGEFVFRPNLEMPYLERPMVSRSISTTNARDTRAETR